MPDPNQMTIKLKETATSDQETTGLQIKESGQIEPPSNYTLKTPSMQILRPDKLDAIEEDKEEK